MQWRVMLIAAFLMLSVKFGHFIGTAPQLKIFEDVIRQKYKQTIDPETPHGNFEFDGDICKSEPVQSELALVSGWKNTLDVLPGMSGRASPSLQITDALSSRRYSVALWHTDR